MADQGVLDLVQKKAATIINEGPPWDDSDIAFLEAIPPLVEALDRLSDYAHHLEDCDECSFVPCDGVGDLGQSLVDADKALADLQEQLQKEQAGA